MKILCLSLCLIFSLPALSRSNNGRYYFSKKFKEQQKAKEVKEKENCQVRTIIVK